ncbi:MAG: hypothetical protein JWR47_1513 [Phenylobacterium sp.]|nr:hypothetical protein [Phenylobacterium sp.]MDB5463756.1 hypothetical protein [Phenylobacterium sp.]
MHFPRWGRAPRFGGLIGGSRPRRADPQIETPGSGDMKAFLETVAAGLVPVAVLACVARPGML